MNYVHVPFERLSLFNLHLLTVCDMALVGSLRLAEAPADGDTAQKSAEQKDHSVDATNGVGIQTSLLLVFIVLPVNSIYMVVIDR